MLWPSPPRFVEAADHERSKDHESVWAAFDRMVSGDNQIRGTMVPNAYLAAVAISQKARLATRDRGFARFPGLNWFDPGR